MTIFLCVFVTLLTWVCNMRMNCRVHCWAHLIGKHLYDYASAWLSKKGMKGRKKRTSESSCIFMFVNHLIIVNPVINLKARLEVVFLSVVNICWIYRKKRGLKPLPPLSFSPVDLYVFQWIFLNPQKSFYYYLSCIRPIIVAAKEKGPFKYNNLNAHITGPWQNYCLYICKSRKLLNSSLVFAFLFSTFFLNFILWPIYFIIYPFFFQLPII